MNSKSLHASILGLAICGVAPACTSPVAPDDPQLPGDGSGDAAGPVHKTPAVPVVIDGVRYAPEDIHRFDGRPLYMLVDLAEPDLLVAFTRQSDFQAAADAKKKALGLSGPSQLAGQYADYFTGDECTGDKLTVYSGWGVNDLRAVARGWWGDWNDVISSVWVNGYEIMYADIQYGGGWLSVAGWGCLNMSTYTFDNIASSLNVWW